MSDLDVVLRQRDRFATRYFDFEVIGQQMDATTGRAETRTLGQLGLKKAAMCSSTTATQAHLPVPFSSVLSRCSCRD